VPVSIVRVNDNPEHAVAALFTTGGVAPDPEAPIRVKRFLGTAFLVYGYHVHFATAKHALSLAEQDELLSVVLNTPSGLRHLSVERIEETPVDLAFGSLSCPFDIELPGFAIAERLLINADVCSLEHSDGGRPVTGGQNFYDPRFRKGYIIGHERSDLGNTAGCQAIDVSYPALKGASGAPVFREKDCAVEGLMVENVDRELLPTQVHRTGDDEDNLIEEIRQSMPHGRAIGFESLNEHLDPFAPEWTRSEALRPGRRSGEAERQSRVGRARPSARYGLRRGR
jgi:hypothetical protein